VQADFPVLVGDIINLKTGQPTNPKGIGCPAAFAFGTTAHRLTLVLQSALRRDEEILKQFLDPGSDLAMQLSQPGDQPLLDFFAEGIEKDGLARGRALAPEAVSILLTERVAHEISHLINAPRSGFGDPVWEEPYAYLTDLMGNTPHLSGLRLVFNTRDVISEAASDGPIPWLQNPFTVIFEVLAQRMGVKGFRWRVETSQVLRGLFETMRDVLKVRQGNPVEYQQLIDGARMRFARNRGVKTHGWKGAWKIGKRPKWPPPDERPDWPVIRGPGRGGVADPRLTGGLVPTSLLTAA
jgi:hypothetical protein